MGFNLGAFLGGAASGGSQILDERRAQADRDKVTKEERQWQIATEERAAARTRKANRASKEKQTAQLLEKLQFHYGDKAQAIANRGIGFAGEALARAGAYQDAGLNPALMVDIPTGKLTDVPAGQAGAAPSAMTFKPITEKDEKDHTTFQARLVAANEDLMKASTEAERVAAQEAFDRINAAHQKFKQEAESSGSGQLDFSKTTRDKMLQDPITNAFKNAGLYKRDINGEITLKFDGNQGQVFSIMDSIITQNEEAFIDVTDKPFITKLQGQRTALNNQVSAYVQNTRNNPEDVFLNTNIPKFVPLENAGTTARSKEEIEQGRKSGEYRPNQVVQYVFTNDNGEQEIGYAIITTTGTLGMGSD
jgi:hypothetical protein